MKSKLTPYCLLGLSALGCGAVPDATSGSPDPVEQTSQAITDRLLNDGSITAFVGQGRSSITEEFLRRCATSTPIIRASDTDSRLMLERSMTENELNETLEASFSGKAKYKLFEASTRASFTNDVKSSERSISMVYSNRAILDSAVIDETNLNWQVSPQSPGWNTACGDRFVREIKRGGELYILARMDFATRSDKEAFEATFGATYTATEVQADLKKTKNSFSKRGVVRLEAYQRGGEVEKLTRIIGGQPNGVDAAVTCSFDNLVACDTFLKNALTYAAGTGPDDFPQNLRRNPADMEFVLQDWPMLGAQTIEQTLPPRVVFGRARIDLILKNAVKVRSRYRAVHSANFFGEGEAFRKRAEALNNQAKANVDATANARRKCYDELGTPMTEDQVNACSVAASVASLTAFGYASLGDWETQMDSPLRTSTFEGRADFVTTSLAGGGHFGAWTGWAMCPQGSHAIGYRQRVEGDQGTKNDDTALNAIELICAPWNRSTRTPTSPHGGIWGHWGSEASCTRGPLNGMRLDSEPEQGKGDDTGGNNVAGSCVSGQNIQASNGAGWGSEQTWGICPAGTAVCGAQVRFEGDQGSNDDTAMNGLNLACCTY